MDERQLKRINKRANKLTISISTPTLNYIDSEGVGNFVIEGTFETPELSINSSGVGNLTAENLNAGYINIDSEGVGNVSCFATEYLKASSNGIGNITYYGKPKETDLSKNGIGKVRSGD